MAATVIATILENARRAPEAPAIVSYQSANGARQAHLRGRRAACGDRSNCGERVVTYGELLRSIEARVGLLGDLGIGPHGRVALRSAQTADSILWHLAIHAAGAAAVPLERDFTPAHVASIVKRVRADALVAESASDVSVPCSVIEGAAYHVELGGGSPQGRLASPNPSNPADIVFTGGTTGQAKGVIISHRALVAGVENFLSAVPLEPHTRCVVPGPLSHVKPLRKLYIALSAGCAFCVLDGLSNVPSFFDAIEQAPNRVGCCLAPSALRMLLTLAGDAFARLAPKIDVLEFSSAPLPEPDRMCLRELFPNARLVVTYGSSESGTLCAYDFNAHPGKVDCVGRPLIHATVGVVDEQGRPFAATRDNPGTLTCEGPMVMDRYLDDTELTLRTLRNGILGINDLGFTDEEGYVYIVGRADDVINVGGLKVMPVEVEREALALPGIADCVCVAAADALAGQRPELLYVAEEGVRPDPDTWRERLSARLEPYKVPRRFRQVSRIEKTFNGKVDRKAYRAVSEESGDES